jgi:sec-independent protein translocase protein TatA
MELVIILLIIVVIFGAGRLSEVGGALGKGIREFRSATHGQPEAAPSTSALPAAGRCASCGASNLGGQAFCGECGARVAQPA